MHLLSCILSLPIVYFILPEVSGVRKTHFLAAFSTGLGTGSRRISPRLDDNDDLTKLEDHVSKLKSEVDNLKSENLKLADTRWRLHDMLTKRKQEEEEEEKRRNNEKGKIGGGDVEKPSEMWMTREEHESVLRKEKEKLGEERRQLDDEKRKIEDDKIAIEKDKKIKKLKKEAEVLETKIGNKDALLAVMNKVKTADLTKDEAEIFSNKKDKEKEEIDDMKSEHRKLLKLLGELEKKSK